MIEIIATTLFGIAVLHTFSIKIFQHLALQYPEGSIQENFFHLLGEVEVIFGLWAGVLVTTMIALGGQKQAVHYMQHLNFTEPLFVFVIMCIAGTRPVTDFARGLIQVIARLLPLTAETAFFVSALIIGPLLGSFITEPAAMTVTALILRDRFFQQKTLSEKFKYATLGVLFVNISIGGVLTHFAAPPVVMVAGTWGWGLKEMLSQFGWKAVIAVCVNTAVAAALFSKELRKLSPVKKVRSGNAPAWLQVIHLIFVVVVVLFAHYPELFIGAFLFFLGVTAITKEYQEELKLRESLLVGFFLAGLVVLGGLQQWWLDPLLHKLDDHWLFIGTAGLTAIADNAALTYLGSQIPNVTEGFKYSLVAGAVAGGGLTVIANAPNPAGFSILKDSFGPEGINPVKLFLMASLPTLVAMACFWGFRTV